ncbi:ARHGB factor, partial [Alopecoenas beccarii]|nr:ARHGB factor [Alopecoenas beccarii]
VFSIPPEPQDPEVQKHATQILRNMLRQEEAELQRFCEAYSRNPGSAVEEQIEGARRRVSQLQLKILQETGGSVDLGRPGGDSGSAGLRAAEGELRWAVGTVPASPSLEHAGQVPPPLPGRLSLDSQDGDSGLESGPERFPSVSECDSLFQDLGKLKSRPAHLGVFLRYIFSQADPSPLV